MYLRNSWLAGMYEAAEIQWVEREEQVIVIIVRLRIRFGLLCKGLQSASLQCVDVLSDSLD